LVAACTISVEIIDAASAIQYVGAVAADEDIVARSALQQVSAIAAQRIIIAVIAEEDVTGNERVVNEDIDARSAVGDRKADSQTVIIILAVPPSIVSLKPSDTRISRSAPPKRELLPVPP
jgi:hypothetical protein